MVRPKKAAVAQKMPGGQPTPKPIAQPYRFPAPIRGWVLNENLSVSQMGGARILDNWIPTTTGVQVRGGARRYATIHATEAVDTLFSYRSGAIEKFFAATASVISEITTVADANVAPTPTVTGRTSGRYSTEHFGTAGGDYLYAVNGSDDPLLYNGTTFTPINATSTPAITGAPTADFSHVWSFANRLFFVEQGSMTAWYLPVDSIGGAAQSFSLAGVFKLGGALLFGAKWSMDAGDGLDDKCVFVSTQGEVAVYEGTNPGSAADWSKAGVYQIAKPLGPNANVTAGGDLLIATEVGLVPISEAVKRDVAALELGAVSQPIAPYWQQQARLISGQNWEIVKLPRQNIMVVSQPAVDDMVGSCLVANLQTGAWSRIVGWKTNCLGTFSNEGYFGGSSGLVFLMNSGGSDDGAPYTCVFMGHHDDFAAPTMQKTVLQMRPVFRSGTPFLPKLDAVVDYDETVSSPPSSPSDFSGNGWDEGEWDAALWDSENLIVRPARWVSIGATGHVVAPVLQLTYGVTPTPLVEFVSIDAAYVVGALVT